LHSKREFFQSQADACFSLVDLELEENKLAGNMWHPIPPVLIQNLGTFLWSEGLRGLVGVDGRIDDRGQFFLLEINPRYTASMELGEMSRGISFAKLHADCFEKSPNWNVPTDPIPVSGNLPNPDNFPRTKAILYARSEIWFSTDIRWPEKFKFLEEKHHIGLFDLPIPGTFVAKGAPILTIIEKGTKWADLKDRFEPILEDLRNQLEHS
jgi:predicted ATP-grasp superfamily ATP-dependent carboligase